ncbi:MAG TPA: hypothetical protein VNJ08_01930 [Bacteriovoracaceae bacterium]|nr:hypothetical protein [Bacteriovoracaceae bacterium]
MFHLTRFLKGLAGIAFIFIACEVLARRFIKFLPAHLDNNSFIVKKRIFDEAKQKNELSQDYVLFVGSSGFGRGLDCLTPYAYTPCYNLSLDGGDAAFYLHLYKKFIRPLKNKPKLIVTELCEMTFGPAYDSATPIKNSVTSPMEHAASWWDLPLNVDFKQRLKNEVETYFLWSALYQLSRKERFAHWTDLIAKKPRPALFVGTFENTNPKKVENMTTFLKMAKEDGVKVLMLPQGELVEGIYSNRKLIHSGPYKAILDFEAQGLVDFHPFPEDEGYKREFFDGQLMHVKQDKVKDFTMAVQAIVEKELARP